MAFSDGHPAAFQFDNGWDDKVSTLPSNMIEKWKGTTPKTTTTTTTVDPLASVNRHMRLDVDTTNIPIQLQIDNAWAKGVWLTQANPRLLPRVFGDQTKVIPLQSSFARTGINTRDSRKRNMEMKPRVYYA